jgi:hypothetical protein
MRFVLENRTGLNERDFMLKLNYHEHRDRFSPGLSYIRRANPGGGFFPRYHAHVKTVNNFVEIELHYDWRRPMHVREARSADREGEVVEREVARIKEMATQMAAAQATPPANKKPQSKGFWNRLFGSEK